MQAAQEKHLQRELSPILLCALVNNNARCYNESMDFAEHMNEILPESLKVSSANPLTWLNSTRMIFQVPTTQICLRDYAVVPTLML